MTDPNNDSAVCKFNIAHVAAFTGNEAIIKFVVEEDRALFLLGDEDGSTPAHLACAGGHLSILQIICSAVPDVLKIVDHDGWTLAHVASFYGQVHILQFISSRSEMILDVPDCDGLLPMHVARETPCQSFFRALHELKRKKRTETRAEMPNAKIARPKYHDAVFDMESDDFSMSPDLKSGISDSIFGTKSASQACNVIANAKMHPEEKSASVNIKLQQNKIERDQLIQSDQALECADTMQTSEQICHNEYRFASKNLSVNYCQGNAKEESSPESCMTSAMEEGQKNHDTNTTSNLDTARSQEIGWNSDISSKEQEGRWRTLLSSLKKGSDITSMLIPAEFLRPESSLERLQDIMQHGRLLEDIVKASNPLERMVAVTRFHISGIIKAIFDGKKPYNPVLGETCAWSFDHGCDTGGRTMLVCEQVSHHPPISAFFLENQRLGLSMQGSAEISPSFLGNSIDVPFKGERKLVLASGETYIMTVPHLQYRGLFVGSRGAEWVGRIFIKCLQTDLVCKLHFKPLGWLGLWGGWHAVEGHIKRKHGPKKNQKEVVYNISGSWDGIVYMTDIKTREKFVLYNFDEAHNSKRPKIVLPLLAERPTDSLLVWKRLSDALRVGDMKLANSEKTNVEQDQRRLKQERSSQNVPWEPAFFSRDGPEWIPKIKEIAQTIAASQYHIC